MGKTLTINWWPGETAYAMCDNFPEKVTIKQVFIKAEQGVDGFSVTYRVSCDYRGRGWDAKESELFVTKEELKQYIFG